MNKDRKTKLIIVVIFLLTAVPGVVFLGAALRAGAGTQKESAMAAVYALLRQNIKIYYVEHGKYPATLSDVYDGSKPDGDNVAIEEFSYTTDGHHFVLKYRGPQRGEQSLEGLDGKIVSDTTEVTKP